MFLSTSFRANTATDDILQQLERIEVENTEAKKSDYEKNGGGTMIVNTPAAVTNESGNATVVAKKNLPPLTIAHNSSCTPADFGVLTMLGVEGARQDIAIIPDKLRMYINELCDSLPSLKAGRHKNLAELIIYKQFRRLIPVLNEIEGIVNKALEDI
jgi:hypothetical protein